MFLCKIPKPPSRASAMANAASVTVSIAAESKGTFQHNIFGKPAFDLDITGDHLAIAGHQQYIIEG